MLVGDSDEGRGEGGYNGGAYAGNAYPSRQQLPRVFAPAGEIEDPGCYVGVYGVYGEEADEGCLGGVVDEPRGGGG